MTIGPRHIAALYVLYASLAFTLLATTMPPFQNPDEATHVLRADQISHFYFAPHKMFGGGSGGLADSGVSEQIGLFANLPFHRERKVTRAMYAPVDWGTPVLTGFSNTVIYPPFFYLPAASIMALARNLGLSVLHGVTLARMTTAVATAAGAAIAISMAGNAAIWLFAVLLLPMSMALSAGVTQDGPMLASTALAVALCLYLRRAVTSHRRAAFVLLCVLLVLVGMARPPYLAFCLMILSTRVSRVWQFAGMGLVALCVVGWSVYNAPYVDVPRWPGAAVNAGAQLRLLIHDPGLWPRLIAGSIVQSGGDWVVGFVGCLGWLDVDLPPWFHYLARASLVFAFIAAWLSGSGPVRLAGIAIVLFVIFIVWNGVMLAEYLTFTPVGAPVIGGVQGRYGLAPALLVGAAIGRPFIVQTRTTSALSALVLATPVVGIVVTIHALLVRYYF